MADTSSGEKRSRAKKSAKRGKGAKRKDVHTSEGVLANLPGTRPQRSSARRDAVRQTASAKVEPTGAPAPKPRRAASATAQSTPVSGRKLRPTASSKAQPAPKQVAAKQRPVKARMKVTAKKRQQDPAPRQGFETEGDPVSGPVQPPGGVDLLSSAAELAGELVEETEVEVDPLVARAIKGSGRRAPFAAAGLGRVRVEDELRVPIREPAGGERRGPDR